ncbi:hypothetical protein QTP88_019547 [Uroleucon formosanum]
MYSHYKGGYTIKVLVAITPNGMVSFLSKSYGGRSSDSYITNDSGFLNKLEPGDQVLADKGFPGIKTGVDGQNSILVIPPMLHNGRFTEEEVLSTYNVASVRIHIERRFAKLKTFNVLNKITSDLLELGHLISNTEIISPFLKIKPSGLAKIQVCNPYKTFDAPFSLISISFIKDMANLFLLSSDVDFNVFIL